MENNNYSFNIENALKWWDSLLQKAIKNYQFIELESLSKKYFNKSYNTVTSEEIEIIWNNEINHGK